MHDRKNALKAQGQGCQVQLKMSADKLNAITMGPNNFYNINRLITLIDGSY